VLGDFCDTLRIVVAFARNLMMMMMMMMIAVLERGDRFGVLVCFRGVTHRNFLYPNLSQDATVKTTGGGMSDGFCAV
jgi:hypothetical protein